MGDDYTGPVTVSDEDGNTRVLGDIKVWSQSETIVEMVKDTDPGDTIPLASANKGGLNKVVEWMEQMAKFKADSASDEGQTWINDYKATMASQDQLPLLISTMEAANFMIVKDLLDELCKFVADIIAQKTPAEILDHFNIETDATPEEEQELISKYKWIDPEGLIAKDREKRLAESQEAKEDEA
ncbi:MAG: SKP1 family protein [Flavobacteriales bacterium]|jgi:S-phase kinase-associated protein 1|nr:SKP1 family protein [Flavobacteriales bacterium]